MRPAFRAVILLPVMALVFGGAGSDPDRRPTGRQRQRVWSFVRVVEVVPVAAGPYFVTA